MIDSRLLFRGRAIARPNQPVAIEPLEARTLLAATLVKDLDSSKVEQPLSPKVEFDGDLISTSGAPGLWRTDTTTKAHMFLGGVAPRNVVVVGQRIHFIDGGSLWISNGTSEGTRALKQLGDTSDAYELFALGDVIYIGGDRHGLWRSDGTVDGTVRLGTVERASHLQEVNGKILFTEGSYFEAPLFRTDGTDAGTVQIKSVDVTSPLVRFGRDAYFLTPEGLWRTNGTSRGTKLVKSIPDGWLDDDSNRLSAAGSRLYFFTKSKSTSEYGYETNHSYLWVSDGTSAGTTTLKDFTDIGTPPFTSNFVPFARRILFAIEVPVYEYTGSQSFTSYTSELWRSDGTREGTARVKTIGSSFKLAGPGIVSGKSLYFTAELVAYQQDIWKTDGTSKGTKKLETNMYSYGPPVLAGGSIYSHAWEDWYAIDLTTDTVLTQSKLDVGPASSNPSGFYNGGSARYFTADDKLWKTNGNTAGTTEVTIAPLTRADISGIPTSFNGSDYFLTKGDDTLKAGLYRLTSTGATLVKEGAFDQRPSLLVHKGRMYFIAPSSQYRDVGQLWSSDGTADGTVPIEGLDFVRFDASWERSRDLFVLADKLYFFASHKGNLGLWITDGSPGGSKWLRDIGTLGDMVSIGPAIGSDGLISVTEYSKNKKKTLWKTRGTTESTVAFADGFYVSGWATMNSTVIFRSDGALCRTDGTTAGTSVILDFAVSTPQNLTTMGSAVYFTVAAKRRGEELWKTDGTLAGTVMVKDIRTGAESSAPGDLRVAKGKLYFSADDGVHGRELWRSDGTASGTVLVADVEAGLASSSPGNFTPLNNLLLFSAYTSAYGNELWKIDI